LTLSEINVSKFRMPFEKLLLGWSQVLILLCHHTCIESLEVIDGVGCWDDVHQRKITLAHGTIKDSLWKCNMNTISTDIHQGDRLGMFFTKLLWRQKPDLGFGDMQSTQSQINNSARDFHLPIDNPNTLNLGAMSQAFNDTTGDFFIEFEVISERRHTHGRPSIDDSCIGGSSIREQTNRAKSNGPFTAAAAKTRKQGAGEPASCQMGGIRSSVMR
jgi:hypothetical protein